MAAALPQLQGPGILLGRDAGATQVSFNFDCLCATANDLRPARSAPARPWHLWGVSCMQPASLKKQSTHPHEPRSNKLSLPVHTMMLPAFQSLHQCSPMFGSRASWWISARSSSVSLKALYRSSLRATHCASMEVLNTGKPLRTFNPAS